MKKPKKRSTVKITLSPKGATGFMKAYETAKASTALRTGCHCMIEISAATLEDLCEAASGVASRPGKSRKSATKKPRAPKKP